MNNLNGENQQRGYFPTYNEAPVAGYAIGAFFFAIDKLINLWYINHMNTQILRKTLLASQFEETINNLSVQPLDFECFETICHCGCDKEIMVIRFKPNPIDDFFYKSWHMTDIRNISIQQLAEQIIEPFNQNVEEEEW